MTPSPGSTGTSRRERDPGSSAANDVGQARDASPWRRLLELSTGDACPVPPALRGVVISQVTWFLAVFSESMAPWSEAPKGRSSKAQGNALGIGLRGFLRPEGATPVGGAAPAGLGLFRELSQGVALGFQLFAPSGLSVTGSYPLKTARNLTLAFPLSVNSPEWGI